MKFYRLSQVFGICLAALLLHSCWDNSQYDPKPYLRPLEIVKLSDQDFLHKSYLKDGKGGYISCNGFIRLEGDEAFVFDTPLNDSISEQLITYIQKQLQATIKGVMVSHFHKDAAGGVQAFINKDIPSYGSDKTASILAKDSIYLSNSFSRTDTILLGKKPIYMGYFGAAHTTGNSVGYIPYSKILFGGCMIKPENGTKGNLSDANLEQWSSTVSNVKQAYPEVQLVIPGHGRRGSGALLDYTIDLFKTEAITSVVNDSITTKIIN